MKQRVWAGALVLVGLTLGVTAAIWSYREHHMMSREFQVLGRRSLQALEKYHDEPDRELALGIASNLAMEAEANRANDPDKRASQFLRNYATAIHYAQLGKMGGWTSTFCIEHRCKELYERCKDESKMFDSGFVPSNSECRDIAEEDK